MIAVDCPACADERAAGAVFCEACGNRLTPEATTASGVTCPHCGTPGGVGEDGYCVNCGMLAGRPRDHLETDLGAIGAGVTDRGRRHHRNEDAVFLVARGADVDAVVCDGVSASYDPDVASAEAAETAGARLAEAGPDGVADAISAAVDVVAALAGTGDPRRAASNPACTIVAASVRGTEIGYGWVGDSRAYWVPADGPAEQLTVDDSWATHAIALGADPRIALASPRGHAITAWLGADSPDTVPRVGVHRPAAPGHLVLCSDGLWNYLPDPAEFGATVREHLLREPGGGPLAAARSLTAYANAEGGADNISVVLIPVGF